MITVLRVMGLEFFHPDDYKIRMSIKLKTPHSVSVV